MSLFDRLCRVIDRRHFVVTGPAQIGVSGGRSSGMMAALIKEASRDLSDVHFTFQNTGFEDTKTLIFLDKIGKEFDIPITWLEFVAPPSGGPPKDATWRKVDIDTASRNGEPFMAMFRMFRDYRATKGLICASCDGTGKLGHSGEQIGLFDIPCDECNGSGKCEVTAILPNPVQRLCTSHMKLKTFQRYLRSQGLDSWDEYQGFRADEPKRIARMTNKPNQFAPLASAKIVKADVFGWWSRQSFDLEIETERGNCVGCFMKAPWKLLWLEKQCPGTLEPWAQMEEDAADQFDRTGHSYRALMRMAETMTMAQLERIRDAKRDDELPCSCGD